MEKKKIILTYGTFDMYHFGHRRVIENSKEDNSILYVGIATDEYVDRKEKKSLLTFEMRRALVGADKLVDLTFAENSLDQWTYDFIKYSADKIRISEEHIKTIKANGKLDDLNIEYFPRTPNISTTSIKDELFNKKVVLTYGTFDLLHKGHINILREAKKLGDILIVGVSTDEFNSLKGKASHETFSERINNVYNNEFVDYVIPEMSWEQKERDIKELFVNILTMGSDWEGKFNELSSDKVSIVILNRTEGISSTLLREELKRKN